MRKLKQKEGKDILILGSPSVCRLLTANDLIDDYRLFLYPVKIGGGIPLFEQDNKHKHFKFQESKTFLSGVLGLHYTLK